uniref:uncharacterized protein LOC122599215 isoform X2 n=1 Tax=Erigeron canadensis TaxID=72917 RepID=UPI001CB9B366|nr:uncharacterized protein LOC122599215 isoform X2 [Erigeron canadensis]
MVFQEAMDIDLPTEASPTEETVGALIEYLVGPLLPLKHTDIAKETPSESKQKSVAKQVHAVAVLYNYYHLNDHPESEFLTFGQFCNLAIMFKPSILPHMKYMCQSDHPVLDDPEKQLSLTEKAIMDACTISETLLDASANVSSMIKEWPVTKVAVLLIDSQKENCFLQFDNGVWSVIEKDLFHEESGFGSKGNKRMRNYNEEGEDGFQQLAFSAVKELTGIGNGKLKVLESHVVYSLSRAKTATNFFIVHSTQSISEDNMVPIQDVISSLQGPVVKKSSGSWVITPVVEYYYLLPYAAIISKLFSRGSGSVLHQGGKGGADTSIIRASHKSFDKVNGISKRVSHNLQVKSILDSGSVLSSNSSKEEPLDSRVTKNGFISNTCSQPVSKVPDASTIKGSQNSCEKGNGESNRVSDNVQVKSKLDSASVYSVSSTEEPRDSRVAVNSFNTNEHSEPISKVPDDVVTSPLKGNLFDRAAKETDNSIGNRITGASCDSMKQKDMNGSCKSESNTLLSGTISRSIDKPLKVYRHEKRTTSTKSISTKETLEDSKKMLIISQTKDGNPDGEKKSCMVLHNEDRLVTVDHAVEDFHITVDAKRFELSEAALRALLHKRQKLYDQQRIIEDELISCDKKIQAIMCGGVGDCLGLKLEAVINCCNEISQQDNLEAQEHAELHGDRSLPLLGKSLSEAQLTLRKACQELDDICLSNNWMLPSYSTTRSDGGYVANVSVKGTNFECSGLSGIQPTIHEARNSAATHVIAKLQQMASEHNSSPL